MTYFNNYFDNIYLYILLLLLSFSWKLRSMCYDFYFLCELFFFHFVVVVGSCVCYYLLSTFTLTQNKCT
jgi:hypothetical protein